MNKAEELCKYLNELGVSACLVTEDAPYATVGVSRPLGMYSLGCIQLEGQNVHSVNVIQQKIPTGPMVSHTYYFVAANPKRLWPTRMWRVTGLIRVKAFPLFGRTVSVKWRYGTLSMALNGDGFLNHLLVSTRLPTTIQVQPDFKNDCVVITTLLMPWTLPSKELFDCYNRIAEHVRNMAAGS